MKKNNRQLVDSMPMIRSNGILMPVFALPGGIGIGDFGNGAKAFIDFLAEAHQTLWQVLPLGPVGDGFSPYSCRSSFAIDPMYISPEIWVEKGYLKKDDIKGLTHDKGESIDYPRVVSQRQKWFCRAFENAATQTKALAKKEFLAFCEQQDYWLHDYALYQVIATQTKSYDWTTWSKPLRDREKAALKKVADAHAHEVMREKFLQFQAHQNWLQVRSYATRQGIKVIGDVPIFVPHESADVWAHPELFQLNKSGQVTHVAGVPPDDFAKNGQRWGNALYRWENHRSQGYRYWLQKIKRHTELFDVTRLDHFIGFIRYWSIPASEKTAKKGRWIAGPGEDFFKVLRAKLGTLPLIAENLGVITPEIEHVRKTYGFPGMGIFQFGIGSDKGAMAHRPHAIESRTVYYTGTHDNDVLLHWYQSVMNGKQESWKEQLKAVVGQRPVEPHWAIIQASMASPALWTIFPFADLCGLGLSRYRINTPGTPTGNWEVRFPQHLFVKSLAQRLRQTTEFYGRHAGAIALGSKSR